MITWFPQYLILGVICLLEACSSNTIRPTHHAQRMTQSSKAEPCWIKRPNCRASLKEDALYFVGQSAQPLAHWGQPNRESKHSAMADAEAQYARFLGVKVQSALDLKESLDGDSYESQVTHQISTDVSQLVSDLVKVDEYFTAYQETDEGQPLWTVYVLVKVERSSIEKHRAMIEKKERDKKQALPKQALPKQALVSQESDQEIWTAKVFNIDDSASISVNGTVVRQCEFSQTCHVDLNPHFKPGINLVRLSFSNRLGPWTYGYKVQKNKTVMYQGKCGQVWLFGCQWDMSRGVIHTFDFKVNLD